MLIKFIGKILNKKVVKLSVFERIVLLEIMTNTKTDFIIGRVLNKIGNKIGFTDYEIENLNIRIINGEAIWKEQFDKNKYVFFSNLQFAIIKDCLNELRNNNIIKEEHNPLVDKFN